jgi:Icc-related predicted phosphoesterase
MKIEINGVKITGFQGSFKYADKDKPLFSHEESVEILNNLEYADIFVTHDKPFLNDNNDPPHDGLKGITNYIYKNKIPFHVHGHLHNNDIKELKNKTISCCVYPFKIIDFNEKGINV